MKSGVVAHQRHSPQCIASGSLLNWRGCLGCLPRASCRETDRPRRGCCDPPVRRVFNRENAVDRAFEVKISLQQKAFSEGAFREAYLAKSIRGLPKGQYVFKKYKKTEVQGIATLFGSVEPHTLKSVQHDALARNMAQCLSLEAANFEFGPTFNYNKVYFSSLNDEFVTLEMYLEGTFTKYINKTGEICMDANEELRFKAETFANFTYVKSNGQPMVTDTQGIGYCLCDPEIASSQQVDEADKPIFFCTDNLPTTAINTFKTEHKCNTYCNLLKLTKISE